MSKKPAVGAALQYARDILGGPLTELETVVAVSNVPIVIAKGNGDRVGLVIVNLGATDVFVGMDAAVGANKGFLLSANGGSATLTVIYDFTMQTREFWANGAAVGPINVYVLELSRYALNEAST